MNVIVLLLFIMLSISLHGVLALFSGFTLFEMREVIIIFGTFYGFGAYFITKLFVKVS